MKNPCYDEKTKTDCPKRYPGCHSKCNDWQEYLIARSVIYDARRAYQKGANMCADVYRNRKERLRKKRRK